MTGGNTKSSTSSGASSTTGRLGTTARTTPVSTKRMADGIFSRAATTATTAITASSSTKIWIVETMRADLPVRNLRFSPGGNEGGLETEDHCEVIIDAANC